MKGSIFCFCFFLIVRPLNSVVLCALHGLCAVQTNPYCPHCLTVESIPQTNSVSTVSLSVTVTVSPSADPACCGPAVGTCQSGQSPTDVRPAWSLTNSTPLKVLHRSRDQDLPRLCRFIKTDEVSCNISALRSSVLLLSHKSKPHQHHLNHAKKCKNANPFLLFPL